MRSDLAVAIACGLALAATPAPAITPDDPGPGDVLLTINAGQSVRPISPYIYGMNSFFNDLPTGMDSGPAIALDRLGGNRWTGYNWETNFSNAGSDYLHVNDEYLVDYVNNTPPGEAVRPALVAANFHDRAVLVTVPTAGYASADDLGTVTEAQTAPSSRWKQVLPAKASIYPGSPLSLTPNEGDNYVFTDEFVNWVESTKSASVPVFYGLDNEPGLWDSTHPRLYPGNPTFAALKSRVIDHATAIKSVAPNAKVFGPTAFGWSEFQSLQSAPDQTTSPSHPGGDEPGEFHYLEWMLRELQLKEAMLGYTLLDVLDIHWYPEATGGGTRITFGGVNDTSPAVVAARVQAPRSLWDPSYVETSWITQFSTGGNGVKLLPRLQRDIDHFKPGTEIAITEYNYGGGNHISGAIAQADVLGIFGQHGVFAGTWWNIEGTTADAAPFVYGAFDMFRNFDAQGGSFGDSSVDAATDDIAASSIYASLDSANPNRMIVVAINRTPTPLDAAIALTSDQRFISAEVYQLTASSPNPVPTGNFTIDLVNAFHYTMPGYSVSTLVLTSPEFEADFDGDDDVDHDDLTHPTLGWEVRYGVDLDGADFLAWQREFNEGAVLSSATAVPEPTLGILLSSTSLGLLMCRSRLRSRNLR